ncbi:hypothetical protein E1B28_003878 [Marasmius oreades]|uniref:Uncharacterized protein n=1 Tax=Marasmius oreades TaxID=181124 RepID=A0A9P7UXE7_9AGAR|nr:uncharacterized protein E1B28_003878 [Marasmius oreades]KAG7096441.1 hypothetical protein E1B28_003878 [Marasmius oreades]
MSSKHHSSQSSGPRSHTSRPSTWTPYCRPAPDSVRPTLTLVEEPHILDCYRACLERAKQQGDESGIRRMEEVIRHAERPHVVEFNYLGMPYTPSIHGPARRLRLDLDRFDLDFVYWDARLIGEKFTFGCTVMPHDLPSTTLYDWREHDVKVFMIDSFDDRQIAVTDDFLMTGVAGQRILIKVPTGRSSSPYASQLVMFQPEDGPLPVPIFALY